MRRSRRIANYTAKKRQKVEAVASETEKPPVETPPPDEWAHFGNRMCMSSALKLGLPRRILDTLEYESVQNPHYSSAASMRLYLTDEVKQLVLKIRQEKDLQRREKKERKLNQLRRYGVYIDPNETLNAMQKEVLSDFLHDKKFSTHNKQQQLMVTVRLANTAQWMQQHLNPPFADRVTLLHPIRAVFAKKDGTPNKEVLSNVLHRSKMVSHVFWICAECINSFLSCEDVANWTSAYPNEQYVESIKNLRHPDTVRNFIHAHIPAEASSKYADIVERIVKRAIKNQNNAYVGKHASIDMIKDLCTSTASERLQRLKNAHIYRQDSSFCRAYVEKTTSAPLGEVVGIMKITSDLFDYGGHIAWSNNHHDFEERFRNHVTTNNVSWEVAYSRVCR
jgi:hypothetical protein